MRTTRRFFLGSAVGALGGLVAGCSERLPRYLVPHAVPPDDAMPGLSRYFRTICRECPAGCGVTARVCEGRVVKLEGSPDHPMSRGGLCPRGQAAVAGLYALDRLGAPRAPTGAISWEEAERALAQGLQQALASGKRIVVLTRPERGSLGALLRTWLTALGQPPDQIVIFDPMDRPWLREGTRRAFATDATPVPDLAAARFLLSIGDDFVEEGSPVEHARALADLRAAKGRFVYVGPRLSLTAAAADEWLSVEPGTEAILVLGLVRALLDLVGGERGGLAPAVTAALRTRLARYDAAMVAATTGLGAATITRLARSLAAAQPSLCLGPGRCVAGADAALVAEAVGAMNAVAGNVGKTVRFAAPVAAPWNGPTMDPAELGRLAAAGEVGALIVHHANPLGFGPAFAPLAAALARVPFVAAFTNELDETAARAQVAIPDHHFLESWSDVTVRAGVTGIQQPAMSPVLSTRPAADVLVAAAKTLGKAAGLPDGTFGDALRQSFDEKEIERGGRFAELVPEPVSPSEQILAGAWTPTVLAGPPGGLPLVVAPTLRHADGLPPRNALLQELPDPLTTISWSGWVELHPTTAAALGVRTGDVVALENAAGASELPAYVTPGVRAGVAAAPVGHAHALLDGRAPALGFTTRVVLRRTGARVQPPRSVEQRSQHGRPLARKAGSKLPVARALPSMYPPVEHPVHRWCLAIDLDRCTGCGACVAACYVENNLPIVGPDEVAHGRDMSWLHVQSFVDTRAGAPAISFLPVGCQQCTNAPCEEVCPTYATYHTHEGLNAQVYPRCVGTRYCENNCPYEARRFNFYDWRRDPRASLGLNPDVTVRQRGVSEKCTFCVQRIRAGEEQAKFEGRALRDGDIVPACAATCPPRAMVFGDLRDPSSEISRWAADGRAYRLLEELNTQPGVVYLARREEKPGP
jgi:molybdopterin-containing oxidoreductase family iron-sulfur binding subunit